MKMRKIVLITFLIILLSGAFLRAEVPRAEGRDKKLTIVFLSDTLKILPVHG